MDAKNRVTVIVKSTIGGADMVFDAWQSVKINTSIETLSGSFSVDAANTDKVWQAQAGSACTVSIGNDVLITGYVDSKTVKHGANSTAINLQGRDKTGDLVDSSAQSKEWAGLSFEEVARQLCGPHGVVVYTQLETVAGGYKTAKKSKGKTPVAKATTGGGALPKKSTNTGDTVHKVLEKLCKQKACLMVSDGAGGLVITRAGLGGAATDLIDFSGNVLSFDYSENFSNLFSEITVKGQSSGAKKLNLATVTEKQRTSAGETVKAKNTTVAGSITRYRPLILQAEEQADAARCLRRAQWEAGNREAKARKITARVQGWRQTDGQLWKINTLATVKSPYTNTADAWLVTGVSYELTPAGTIAELTLYSPLAYEVLPDIPKNDGGGGVGKTTLATVKPR